jgi:hypothetical protein
MSPRYWAALQEAQLRRELAREQASNGAFAARCPGVPETECYRRGPFRSSEFYTVVDFLRASIKREHQRFNPARCTRGALYRKF